MRGKAGWLKRLAARKLLESRTKLEDAIVLVPYPYLIRSLGIRLDHPNLSWTMNSQQHVISTCCILTSPNLPIALRHSLQLIFLLNRIAITAAFSRVDQLFC